MSKVGKKPILIPGSVKIDLNPDDNILKVKGSKGELSKSFDKRIKIDLSDAEINVKRESEVKEIKMLHGLTRALIANMIKGVTDGFSERLELHGVGYRATITNGDLVLSLGYTHPIIIKKVEGIEFIVPAETIIEVHGIDRELVGLIASKIRSSRNPDPYKGKGVKYSNEILRKKAGKALGKAGA